MKTTNKTAYTLKQARDHRELMDLIWRDASSVIYQGNLYNNAPSARDDMIKWYFERYPEMHLYVSHHIENGTCAQAVKEIKRINLEIKRTAMLNRLIRMEKYELCLKHYNSDGREKVFLSTINEDLYKFEADRAKRLANSAESEIERESHLNKYWKALSGLEHDLANRALTPEQREYHLAERDRYQALTAETINERDHWLAECKRHLSDMNLYKKLRKQYLLSKKQQPSHPERKKTGPRPSVSERVEKAMRAAVAGGYPLAETKAEALAEKFKASRPTCIKVRNAILSELSSREIETGNFRIAANSCKK